MKRLKTIEKKIEYALSAGIIIASLVITSLITTKSTISLPLTEEAISLYSNQTHDNLERVVIEAITTAKKAITLYIYSLSDYAIIDHLRKKSEEGIRIQIIVDASATPHIERQLGPKIELYRRHYKGLMHHKILVIDHTQVYFGTTNFTRDSFFLHGNLMVGLHCRPLAEEIENKARGIFNEIPHDMPPICIANNKRKINFYVLPENAKEGFSQLERLIQTAQKSIKVAIYTFTHKTLVDRLIEAKNRGVAVEVVFDYESARQTSNKAYVRLKREGVATFVRNRTGLLHHKTAIIDDEILATGSANWTQAAFGKNDDLFVIIAPMPADLKSKAALLWQTIRNESKSSL